MERQTTPAQAPKAPRCKSLTNNFQVAGDGQPAIADDHQASH